MKRSWSEVFNKRTIRAVAGSRSFARGEDYFLSGKVHALTEDKGVLTAKVRGSRNYRVKFWMAGEKLSYSCNCPLGAEDAFCKHLVAVGLAFLEPGGNGDGWRKPSGPVINMDDVRAYLRKQGKETLVNIIAEQATDDDRLREQLLMKAATKGPKGLDLAAYRAAIDHAVDTEGFVDYHSAWDYFRRIEDVVRSVEGLLKEGYAKEALELSEYFLESIEECLGEVDGSDGNIGSLLEELQEIHHKACRKAKPDPEVLAKKLFNWELRTDYDTFYHAAATYKDVLGEKGLALYRKLAEVEWAQIPELHPGASQQYGKRFRITSIIEALARASDDIEALVAVMSRDLSHAYHYFRIAEECRKARQHDKALDWAERGIKAFPERTDSRLRDFLAEEYHRRKRHDDAMKLIWAEFTDQSNIGNYQKLAKHAKRISRWPAWREKALTFLREYVTKARKKQPENRWGRTPDHSTLVEIFIWEKDYETAWKEAKEGGCYNRLWLELAAKREKDHPEGALEVYRQQVEPTVNQKNNGAYQQAVDYLVKVRDLMVRLDREAEFMSYLEFIRIVHKPKRNFTPCGGSTSHSNETGTCGVKLIDSVRWQSTAAASVGR